MREMTEKEVEEATAGYKFDLDGEVFEFRGDSQGGDRRWHRRITCYFERVSDGTFWSLEYDRGLTEYQDNEYWEQVPRQVKRKEETRVVVSWVPC